MNYTETIKNMIRYRTKELWEQMVDEAPDYEDVMDLYDVYIEKAKELAEGMETMIEGAKDAEMIEADELKELKEFISGIMDEFDTQMTWEIVDAA